MKDDTLKPIKTQTPENTLNSGGAA